MKAIIGFVASILFSAIQMQVIGQEMLRPGYVLPVDGDTIRCYIRKDVGETITFGPTQQSEGRRTLRANEVKAFGFSSVEHYHPVNLPDRVVFAKLELSGAANVYSVGDDFHIVTSGDVVVPVQLKIRKVEKAGLIYEIEDKEYIYKLNTLFADCSMDNDFSNVQLINKSFEEQTRVLTSLASKYSKCKNVKPKNYNAIKFARDPNARRFYFSGFAGINWNKLEVTSGDSRFDQADWTYDPTFSAGGNVTYFFSDQNTWSAVFGLSVHRTNATGFHENEAGFTHESRIKYRLVKLPIGFQYRYRFGKNALLARVVIQRVKAANVAVSITETSPFTGKQTTNSAELSYRATFSLSGSLAYERAINERMFIFLETVVDDRTRTYDSNTLEIAQRAKLINLGIRF